MAIIQITADAAEIYLVLHAFGYWMSTSGGSLTLAFPKLMLVLAVGLAIAGIVAAVVSLFHQPKPRYTPSQLWVRNTGVPWVKALDAPPADFLSTQRRLLALPAKPGSM